MRLAFRVASVGRANDNHPPTHRGRRLLASAASRPAQPCPAGARRDGRDYLRVVRYSYQAFYARLSLTTEDVGNDSTQILTTSGLGIALLLIATVFIFYAFWISSTQWVMIPLLRKIHRRLREAERDRWGATRSAATESQGGPLRRNVTLRTEVVQHRRGRRRISWRTLHRFYVWRVVILIVYVSAVELMLYARRSLPRLVTTERRVSILGVFIVLVIIGWLTVSAYQWWRYVFLEVDALALTLASVVIVSGSADAAMTARPSRPSPGHRIVGCDVRAAGVRPRPRIEDAARVGRSDGRRTLVGREGTGIRA